MGVERTAELEPSTASNARRGHGRQQHGKFGELRRSHSEMEPGVEVTVGHEVRFVGEVAVGLKAGYEVTVGREVGFVGEDVANRVSSQTCSFVRRHEAQLGVEDP